MDWISTEKLNMRAISENADASASTLAGFQSVQICEVGPTKHDTGTFSPRGAEGTLINPTLADMLCATGCLELSSAPGAGAPGMLKGPRHAVAVADTHDPERRLQRGVPGLDAAALLLGPVAGIMRLAPGSVRRSEWLRQRADHGPRGTRRGKHARGDLTGSEVLADAIELHWTCEVAIRSKP